MAAPTVVILGLNISGLGVLQSLGEREVSLLGIDRCKTEIGFYSKYGRKVVCEDQDLVEYLVNLGKDGGEKSIILPTSDEYLLLVSRAEQILSPLYHLPFPKNELLEQILHKYSFFQLAAQFTDNIPYSSLLTQDSCEKWNQWPAIVKPVFIHEFRKFYPNRKAWVVRNKEELADKCSELETVNVQAIVQEIVSSKDSEQYSVCLYLDRMSAVKKSMVTQKIRQNPPGYGVGTYVEIIDDKELVTQTWQLLKKIGYVGIAEVEYRRDRRDNKLKLIEINSRVWTQSKLASYGGADIVGAACSDLAGNQLEPLPNISRHWIFFPRDIITCFQYLLRKEVRIRDIMATYLHFWNNTGAIWSRHDLRPSFFLPLYLFRKIYGQKKS